MKNKFTAKDIIGWYNEQKRDLPWRKNNNFYKVWISEVMLQQTKITTVIPYYKKWINKFKTIEAVANAKQNDILKVWEGLGYYARARNFHNACKEIKRNNYNTNTIKYNEFKNLKGVGDYTANAVYSICRNEPYLAIDANVKRIMSRILMLSFNQNKEIITMKNYLQSIIPNNSPGDFNQALMELGERICKPKKPKCTHCPINYHCLAFKKREVHNFPNKLPSKIIPHIHIAVGIIWKDNQILITKRKPNGLLGGLWEFPGGKVINMESLEDCVVREIKEELDIEIKVGKFIKAIEHKYSHFSITMHAFHCRYKNGIPKMNSYTDLKLITINDFKKYAFPKANHKLFPFIENQGKN